MGRNKNLDTNKRIEYLLEFINTKCGGNPNSVMFSKLARYITEKEQKEISRKSLSRDKELQDKLTSLKEEYNNKKPKTCAYVPLDIDRLLLKCKINSNELRDALLDREKYFQQIYMFASQNIEEQNNIKELNKRINTLKNKTTRLSTENNELVEKNKKLKDMNNEIETQNKKLLNYIKDKVYPECFEEFLIKEKLLDKEDFIINRERFIGRVVGGATDISIDSSDSMPQITDIMSKIKEI